MDAEDRDRGPHESWCDCLNNISDLCNCMATSYIEIIERYEKALEKCKEQRNSLIPQSKNPSAAENAAICELEYYYDEELEAILSGQTKT